MHWAKEESDNRQITDKTFLKPQVNTPKLIPRLGHCSCKINNVYNVRDSQSSLYLHRLLKSTIVSTTSNTSNWDTSELKTLPRPTLSHDAIFATSRSVNARSHTDTCAMSPTNDCKKEGSY